VRRIAPRPLGTALAGAVAAAAPPTLIARIQVVWPEVAGSALAHHADPVSERDGVVTVACESAVWAQELELLGPELSQRLTLSLGADEAARIERLRFVVGSSPKRF
jgi:predicted nucleic acid-binding Zn ribbon protein